MTGAAPVDDELIMIVNVAIDVPDGSMRRVVYVPVDVYA